MTFIHHPSYTEVKHGDESGSGYDEYDSGSASLYYADEASSSGSGNWDDDNDEGECRTLAILYGSCIDQNSTFLKKMPHIVKGCKTNRNLEERWLLPKASANSLNHRQS